MHKWVNNNYQLTITQDKSRQDIHCCSVEETREDRSMKAASTRRTLTVHELMRMSSDGCRNLTEYECVYWHLLANCFVRDGHLP